MRGFVLYPPAWLRHWSSSDRPVDDAGDRRVDDAGGRRVDDAGDRRVDDAGDRRVDDAGDRRVDDAGNWPVDVAVATIAAVLAVAGAVKPGETVPYELAIGGLPLVAAAAAAGLALLWRRRYPVQVFVFDAVVVLGVLGLGWEAGALPFTLLIAAYSLGAFATARQVSLGVMLAAAGMVTLSALDTRHVDEIVLISAELATLLLIGSILGLVVARRRRRGAHARERALALAREGAVTRERALLADRLHLARELHDVVMNGLTAITVQAASAQRGANVVGPVLATIEQTCRAATDDLRRMLGALRIRGDEAAVGRNTGAVATDTAGTGGDAVGRNTGAAGTDTARTGGDGAVPDGTGVDAAAVGTSAAETRRDRAGPRAWVLRAIGWIATDDRPDAGLGTPLWPIDLALGLGLMLINVAGSIVLDSSGTVQRGDSVLPVLVMFASLPGLALIVRRRFPIAVFAVTFSAVSAVMALGWEEGNLPASLLVASYAVGSWAPIPRGAYTLAAMCAAMALLAVVSPNYGRTGSPVDVIFFLAAWIAGVVIRRRRIADERSVAQALAAERANAAAMERARAQQRLAMARDLHDLVTHSIAGVTVQAASARHQLAAGREYDALTVIEDAARAALTDLRRMLELLHDGQHAELDPPPGLGDIETLAELHRHTHGPVTLHVDREVEQEPARIRLTAYRLVQEALTNVAKHTSGAAATVAIRSTPAGVVVEIENEGGDFPLSASPQPGFGLAGMGERVALLGGSLVSRSQPDGGFLVRAELDREVTA